MSLKRTYGRFSGGVINAVTKSGGNRFQGSFRTDITNPEWQDESLVEKNAIATGRGQPHIDDTSFVYSATLGGPVVKDRLWFFGAYRRENSAEARALSVTGAGYGVLSPNFYAEGPVLPEAGVQRDGGQRYRDHRLAIPRPRPRRPPREQPLPCPVLQPARPRRPQQPQYAGALSYFLSTGRGGRHDLKLGGEYFTSSRTGGNSQSVTGYVFLADPVVAGGQPQRDSAGNMIPNFQPGLTQIQNWRSVQGAQIDLNTAALYLNDRWQLSSRWTLNLGMRFERHTTDATQAGITSISSSAFARRLGATFDVKGDGQWILQATYGHYAGKAAETQFADNTNVGTPSLVQSLYTGPAGTGVGFTPGFKLANYRVVGGNFPVANVFLDTGRPRSRTGE